MCSRFELNVTPRDLVSALSLRSVPPIPNRDEVRPTDAALTVGPDREGKLLTWGFTVDWSKSPMINARSETLDEKPTFRPHLENRCIVPASAYFEWRVDETGKKRKNRIHATDRSVIALAGLIAADRFTIVTCEPAPSIGHVHDRMPVILDEAAMALWLDTERPFSDVRGVLTPYPGPLAADEEIPPPPAQADLFA